MKNNLEKQGKKSGKKTNTFEKNLKYLIII